MPSPEEQRQLEEQFRELVSTALEDRWQREGRYSAKDVFADILSNEDVWKRMAEQFAQRAAVLAIRRQMAARSPSVHHTQESFPFAKELPVPSITYKGSVVSTLRSTAEEYIWFSNWYERRHTGTVRRSKVDKKELARIKRFAQIVERYRGDDPKVTIEGIIQTWQKRLEVLRKQRKNKK